MWNPFTKQSNPSAMPAVESEVEVTPPSLSRRHPIAEVEIVGTTAVATLTVTELTQDESVEQLVGLLDDLREMGAQHFVLDIQNVQHMDSACLGCLVEALNRMASTGGRIALANTDANVQYLFRLTRLDRVFPICADVMAAIEAVEKDPNAEE